MEMRGNSDAFEFRVVTLERGTDGEPRLDRVVALPGIGLQRAEENQDAVAEERTDAPAVLGNAVADELEVAVQHARQRLRIELFGERRVAHQVGEHRGEHLVLGDAFRPVGKQAFDHAGRREQRTGLLQAFQLDRGGLDTCAHLAQALPLPGDQPGRSHQREQIERVDVTHGRRGSAARSRHRAFASDTTPIASTNCAADSR